MLIHQDCLLCNLKQVYKIIKICNLDETAARELIAEIMTYLSKVDYTKTNSEIMGEVWELILKEINNPDPYFEIKKRYNNSLADIQDELNEYVDKSEHSLKTALKLSIIANQIDFASSKEVDFTSKELYKQASRPLYIDESKEIFNELGNAKILLYIGDNCGEIVLDKIFIRVIKNLYPKLEVYYGVRGTTIVNDITYFDAEMIGMNEFATIIDNGSKDLGTVLANTSDRFRTIFHAADVIVSKGQGNFESLCNTSEKKPYYLLTVKCERISKLLNVPVDSLVCCKI